MPQVGVFFSQWDWRELLNGINIGNSVDVFFCIMISILLLPKGALYLWKRMLYGKKVKTIPTDVNFYKRFYN